MFSGHAAQKRSLALEHLLLVPVKNGKLEPNTQKAYSRTEQEEGGVLSAQTELEKSGKKKLTENK